ncbi:MAG: sulfatase-like hydrolase/transferase [Firmicutes bacterium]|nr:sulfatase-like hydrolase/transferase [Bacillota bacterium]
MEKFKSFCSRNHVVVIFALSFLLVLIIESLGRHSPVQAVVFMVQNPLVYLANMALVFSLLSLSMLFKRRVFVTTLLSIVWLALGIVNGVILSNRMTPFTVKDLSNLNEAIAIVENYFSVGTVIAFIVVVALLVLGIVVLYRKAPKKPTELNFKKDLAAVLIVFVGAFGIIQVGQKIGVLDTFFGNLAIGYADNGVCYSFVITWMDTGIDKPEEYSAQAMKDIFDKGELGDDGIYTPGKDDDTNVGDTPNILYLQLESFFDPYLVKGLEFSQDPIPYFRSLMDEYSTGELIVPSVGAGTANVEFEVMTGISARFFGPGEYPYKSVLKEETCETTAYDLKQLGYSTHAIHNHRGAFYYRNIVFANMGFDTFTCLEYMNNVMKTPKNWAKDGILTENIMSALESTKNKDYIYTISVQGHGRYPDEQVLENPLITCDNAATEELKWNYEYYANQIYEMDLFVKELTEVLSNYDEDVILIMYGDHLPALDMTADDLKTGDLYASQYVIWDNFGMAKEDKDLTTYELNAEVMDRLGISVGMITKYQQNHKGDKNYLANLEALGYDMLYGKRYIYGEKNPFETTDMKMGVKTIKVDEVVKIGDEYYIKGQNFTEYSKISLDGKILDTVYLGPTILALKEKVDPEEAVNMKVSQVEKNKEVLSTTE